MIVVDVIDSAFGTIEVLQRRSSGSLLYKQGGVFQSEADQDGASLASYIHAIYGLILQSNAQNVLVIGCGGGTLATMLAKASRNVTMIDINPVSFAVARKYFKLPVTVKCHASDGQSFLRRSHALYDAIVIDAYNGNRVPAHLESPVFFDLTRRRLFASGSAFAYVHLENNHDRHADRIAASMALVWDNVRILDTEGALDRNAIVMAGDVSQLDGPNVMVQPTVDTRMIERELLSMKFRPCRAEIQQ
jgi:spermidine synthase